MVQFILDAMRGAAAYLLIIGIIGLVIWLVVPGMDFAAYSDPAARFASRMRTFNAMFGGLALIGILAFCLLAYGANH